jgi:hypothetical protein
LADAGDPFDDERRRLAGMLPGAEIERAGTAVELEAVALVGDLDRPIAVLIERGGYVLESSAPRLRRLRGRAIALTLTDDRGEFDRRAAPGATS